MTNNSTFETIELTMPVNSAYVSAIRLTASSVSNRLKFNANEIEDIKSAVSECCAFLIGKANCEIHKFFSIKFHIYPNKINICFSMPHMPTPSRFEDDMALMMVKALMDEFEIRNEEDDSLTMAISKIHSESYHSKM